MGTGQHKIVKHVIIFHQLILRIFFYVYANTCMGPAIHQIAPILQWVRSFLYAKSYADTTSHG